MAPPLLLVTLLGAVLHLAAAQPAAFNPALIVPNINSGCPVPNVNYPPEVFDTSKLIAVFAPLTGTITNQACSSQALSLAGCALDGSLAVQSGCCSSSCAAQMQQLKTSGCFGDIAGSICNAPPAQAPQAQALLPILTAAAQRCADITSPPNITCPDGRNISTGAAAAAATAAPTTAAAPAAIGAGAPAAEPPAAEGGAGAPMAEGAGAPMAEGAGAPMPEMSDMMLIPGLAMGSPPVQSPAASPVVVTPAVESPALPVASPAVAPPVESPAVTTPPAESPAIAPPVESPALPVASPAVPV